MKLQKNLYIALFVITCILMVITVVVSFSGTSGTEESFFKSPWIVFVFAAYVFIQILCLFSLKPKFTLYRAGFYALHIGLVLFLVGSFLFYIGGDSLNVSVPVGQNMMYNEVRRNPVPEGKSANLRLDFYLGVADFKVERYDAVQDKFYEATLRIMPEGSREVESYSLTVNHPHREDGWKIYLMNYDRAEGNSVQLLFKYDPGEYISLAGIWLSIVGSVLMCLVRKREAGDAA
ncbi:MAG: cytochrome c biogenesis protein ResB [Clostridia bacterium]|nr:cytochrome c biogenesis protein ResB [Clostridia bacterium]